MGSQGPSLPTSARPGLVRHDLLFRKEHPHTEQRAPRAPQAAWASTLTLLKDDPGSTLEVLLGGRDGGKEFLVGAVDVWVGDQVIVESPVNAGFCPLFSPCQRGKDVSLDNRPTGPESGQLPAQGRDTIKDYG